MSDTAEKPVWTKPLPDMRPEGDPFWAGTKEHKLLLPAAADGTPFWYPRANVPGTLEPTQWVESKGEGTRLHVLHALHRAEQGLQGRPAAHRCARRLGRWRTDDDQHRPRRGGLPLASIPRRCRSGCACVSCSRTQPTRSPCPSSPRSTERPGPTTDRRRGEQHADGRLERLVHEGGHHDVGPPRDLETPCNRTPRPGVLEVRQE